VPVYITYLTAAPEGKTIAFRSDVYGRDGASGRGMLVRR
jgi:murein L,D-transpeptidase YcbB/YkuD